jgi:alginate O-acetyltransferase complex protein AlgJ
MSEGDDEARMPPQTPAQWAVRWHGLVAVALLVLAVPAWHLVWHGLLGRERPLIVHRGQTAAPELSWRGFADGSWMTRQDDYLRSASPIAWWLRGSWNELLLRAGAPQSEHVCFGRDGWMFAAGEIRSDTARVAAASPARRRLFAEVRERLQRLGVDLLVTLIPDKARVYPEFAWRDGSMPPERAAVYDVVLADLRAAGVATVDLVAAMRSGREVHRDELLYYVRDTHWRPYGALVAARATAAAIDAAGFARRLAPPRALELGGARQDMVLSDLVALLGLCTIELPGPAGTARTVSASATSAELAEMHEYYGLVERTAAGAQPLDEANAEILHAGTSFAAENGRHALAFALQRPVRSGIEMGAAGLRPIRGAVTDLEARGAGSIKLVVWEIVERGLDEDVWSDPRL